MSVLKKKIIVIGNGMVGYKFCEKMVDMNLLNQYELVVFGEEPWVAYDRVHLSEYFSGSTVEDLQMAPRSWYESNDIQLNTAMPIVDINLKEKEVITHKGNRYSYDKLVFASGSSAFVPPIKGVEKDGVFVYRNIEDLDQIKAYGGKIKSGAVIGGGLLGLEAAKALLDLGLEIHVVEFASRIMPRQLDDRGADVLKTKIESLGVKIHNAKNTSFFMGNETVTGLSFSDETELKVDMVVISAGIKPRDEVAKKVGIEVGERGGIVVDDKMKTSVEDVYAIGEAALFEGKVYGLVAPGYDMADVVVNQLAGENKAFKDCDMSTKLKLIGVDVASFGDALGEGDHKSIVYENASKGVYKRINISPNGKYLLGGILVGEAEDYNMLLQTVINKIKLPDEPESLLIKAIGGGDSLGGVEQLPDDAMICSCENVNKGNICQTVKEGCHDLGDLKQNTKAGTGCGGCLPLVKDLMSDTLKNMGVSLKKTICEHFEYSRQELFDIIKVKGYKSYKEVLHHAGNGHGCEICKPAVGSILASLWNDKVLNQDTIQDTNDRFLANIQRGGTYSVIPRIAGGEVTPEKLIVMGEIAKKYDLYCKITGGQRIDLLGAQVGDLPLIWEELVEAGFESGHAYGKAVRTVKSCVGSTWCRYGVQDAVTMAVDVENRYKGLRAPHKLKFAVSGCTRECAEAQSKDIGIIATEKGWALYVCGNGGSKPQHALLFATDLDTETCIRYIDRILMFYVRTADSLTRTATWLNKLEGGLEYLKDVVINDSLGICDELEQHMKNHMGTYHCEWKDVVEDPKKRAKFTHFVNSDERDETLEFVDERGQKVPKPW